MNIHHVVWRTGVGDITKSYVLLYINIFAKESSRSDWGSNPRPTATPPSTKYQRSNPLSQIIARNVSEIMTKSNFQITRQRFSSSPSTLYY
jgi:hypothetical protein